MKLHVKFQGSFWLREVSYKHFGEIFSQKPEEAELMYYTAHFVKILITYPIHEEEMLKSKYYYDSLSDFHKIWYHGGVIASVLVSLLVHRSSSFMVSKISPNSGGLELERCSTWALKQGVLSSRALLLEISM